MAGKYMPPHMRYQTISTPQQPTERHPDDGYTLEEIAYQFNCKHKVGTLNSNADIGQDWNSSCLAFVVLFRHQHPEWPPKLFCKSNLNLLPLAENPEVATKESKPGKQYGTKQGTETKEAAPGKTLSKAIPLFTEAPFPHSKRAGVPANQHFLFSGYYVIISVTLFDPESPELVALLDKKFTPEGKRRSAEAWQASLARGWAVVQLEREGGDGNADGNPMVPLKEVKRGGVREMLEALRLGEGGDEEGKENGGVGTKRGGGGVWEGKG